MLKQVDASALPLAMITVTLIPGDATVIRSSKRVEAAKWSSEGTVCTYGDHAELCANANKAMEIFGPISSSGCFHLVAKYVAFTARGRHDESTRQK